MADMDSDEKMKDIFTIEEFDSPYYRIRDPEPRPPLPGMTEETQRKKVKVNPRKRVLVTIFSQTNPIGSNHNCKEIKSYRGREMDADAYELFDFFKTKFRLRDKDIKLHMGRKVKEVHEILNEIGDNDANEVYDVFFFVFLTYLAYQRSKCSQQLKEERLQFYDGSETLETFLEKIKDKKPFLMRPKIFLVQADDLSLKFPKDIAKSSPYEIKTMKIPTDADRLIIKSTIPQFFANLPKKNEVPTSILGQMSLSEKSVVTQPSDGQEKKEEREKQSSLMIQAFVDVMNDEDYVTEDVFSRTPYINGRVQELASELEMKGDYEDLELPTPVITSTLTKFLHI